MGKRKSTPYKSFRCARDPVNPSFLSTVLRPMPTAYQQKPTSGLDLIFLGTGTSGSVPNISCLTAPPDEKPCETCLSTLTPEGKKNIRRNTSAIVRVDDVGGNKVYVASFEPCRITFIQNLLMANPHLLRTILIDAGKNFQAAALEWFPKYGLRRIDAVLLTHGHADGKRRHSYHSFRCFDSHPFQP